MKRKIEEIEYLTILGHEVTIHVYKVGGGYFSGSWSCSSFANCLGASGHSDREIKKVIEVNTFNAETDLRIRMKRAETDSSTNPK